MGLSLVLVSLLLNHISSRGRAFPAPPPPIKPGSPQADLAGALRATRVPHKVFFARSRDSPRPPRLVNTRPGPEPSLSPVLVSSVNGMFQKLFPTCPHSFQIHTTSQRSGKLRVSCRFVLFVPEAALRISLYYRAQKDTPSRLPARLHGGVLMARFYVAFLALKPLSFAALFPEFCSS